MTTTTTLTQAQRDNGPHNHWACRGNCAGRPLTLADRELITGRSDIGCYDEENCTWFCGDCLADLPAGYEALFHICGQEPEVPEPAPMEAAPAGEACAPRSPRKGDVAFYHGSLTEYRGVYEVASARGGRLRLVDMERCLTGVAPEHVTVGGRVRRQRKRGAASA